MSIDLSLGTTIKLENGMFSWKNGEPEIIYKGEAVAQHCRRILETIQGTDFLRPQFGLDLRSLFETLRYANTEEATLTYIEHYVIKTLMESDERISNVDVREVRALGRDVEIFLTLRLIDGKGYDADAILREVLV